VRKKRLLNGILCGVFICLLVKTPVDAQNVSVTDYTVPVSRADNLRIDGLDFNFVTVGEKIQVESGDGGLVYKRFYNSLPYAYSFDFIGTASYNREPSGNRVGTFATDLDVKVQKYFRETNKFFYSLSPSILYRKNSDRPQVDVTIGLGYGRFINATPLRKAVRIEDFLLTEGIITNHLPKNTMIELGHIIDKKDEYRDLYGDRSYENYWYEDMSNEINKTGLVLGNKGNVGPIGILRMRDVLIQENINDRFFGWDASAGVQYQVFTEEKGIKRPTPAMAISLRYSRPISWSTQINTDFKFNTPFDSNFGKNYNLTQKVDIIYEITNKIAFTSLNTIVVDKKQLLDAQISVASTAGFTFFIENKVSLSINEQISKNEGTPFRQSFGISLNYRLF
jgi:hypothetical protein